MLIHFLIFWHDFLAAEGYHNAYDLTTEQNWFGQIRNVRQLYEDEKKMTAKVIRYLGIKIS